MSLAGSLQAIEFVAGRSAGQLRGDGSTLLPSALYQQAEESSRVIVLPSGSLPALPLGGRDAPINDRGRKHPGKPLSAYLPASGGAALVRAGYSNPGQAERGIRAVLRIAAQRPLPTTLVVAVPESLFAALSKRATPASSDATAPDLTLLGDDCGLHVPDSLRREFLGDSDMAESVRRAIVLAADMDRRHAILIQGESGTGKEIVARQVHALGGCGLETFFAVNCGGIPAELFESELFGHVKGSFTGAVRDKKGFWTLANKGTLFLDEIADLSLAHQVKVLRALNEREFTPVGAERSLTSDARVIAATNRDLAQMVKAGTFREDLYYRLFTFRIRTPALREHPADIPLLARHLWERERKATPLPGPVTDLLATFPWPGNVRELRAFLINLAVVANGRRIDTRLVEAVMRDRIGMLPQRHTTAAPKDA